MANTYVNKVTLSNGTTLIDLTSDTVTSAAHIVSGRIGHLSDGSVVTGTAETGSGVASIEDVPNATGTTAVIDGTDASHIVADYDLSETALGSDGSVDLSEAIEALTTYSNEVTGESDTTLSEAVATLAEGYGSGGYDIEEIAAGISGDIVITGTTLHRYGFAYTNITSVVADNVATPGSGNAVGMFIGCTKLTSLHMASLTGIPSSNQFCSGCIKLTSIYLPKIEDLGNMAFQNCTSLVRAALPSAWGSYQSFTGCSNLEVADYGAQGTNRAGLNSFNFSNCQKLKTLILRGEDYLHNLSNINSFNGTPFASGGSGGTIYIPKSLYDQLGTGTNDYKSATNWSTLDGYGTVTWAAIEGSQYENYYADGTAIS